MRGTAATYARSAATSWNLFGVADLVNAVVLRALTNGVAGGIVFLIVLIPAYGVPRVFLIHSYSLSLVGEISGSPIRSGGCRRLGSRSPRIRCGIARLQLVLFVASCLSN